MKTIRSPLFYQNFETFWQPTPSTKHQNFENILKNNFWNMLLCMSKIPETDPQICWKQPKDCENVEPKTENLAKICDISCLPTRPIFGSRLRQFWRKCFELGPYSYWKQPEIGLNHIASVKTKQNGSNCANWAKTILEKKKKGYHQNENAPRTRVSSLPDKQNPKPSTRQLPVHQSSPLRAHQATGLSH